MGALFRLITRRPNGREVVKVIETAEDVFTVGRGTDCALQLPDLRVGLAHLKVTAPLGGPAIIEAVSGHSFAHRTQNRQTRLVFEGGRQSIDIAPYHLAFSRDQGRLVIEVTAVEAGLPFLPRQAGEDAFALKGAFQSRRFFSWSMTLLVLAGCLAFPLWVFAHRSQLKDAPSASLASGALVGPPGPNLHKAAEITAGKLWSAGPLSPAHAFLGASCKTCHAAALVSVKDQTCLHCHSQLKSHAAPHLMATAVSSANGIESAERELAAAFDKPLGRCGSCHVEHMGKDALKAGRDRFCTQCHSALDQRLGRLAEVANVSGFVSGHPDFRPTLVQTPGASDRGGPAPVWTRRWTLSELDRARRAREAAAPLFDQRHCDGFSEGKPNFRGVAHMGGAGLVGDNSGLVFPHALHLSKQGCVAALYQRLDLRTGEAGGLECASCHKRDPSGRSFVPVDMERNCSACHSLVFDNFQGQDLPLPHGKPKLVIRMMGDFYTAEAVKVATKGDDEDRHPPGQAAKDQSAALRKTALTQADQRAVDRVAQIFSRGGSCYGCHLILKGKGPLDYDVAPVTHQNQFFPRAEFDHQTHQTAGLTCDQCHGAGRSNSSADVLMPGIKTCRTCHGQERATSATPSPCITCHRFHGAGPGSPAFQPGSLEVLAGAGTTGVSAIVQARQGGENDR